MRSVRGPALALGAFAVAFALHIVGGATDQDWLFAIAVAAIFVLAAGFPVFAMLLGDARTTPQRRAALALGGIGGAVLLAGTLWAANDRAWAWWTVPAACAVAAVATAGAGRITRAGAPA